jgi:hypothetical protein
MVLRPRFHIKLSSGSRGFRFNSHCSLAFVLHVPTLTPTRRGLPPSWSGLSSAQPSPRGGGRSAPGGV